MKYLQSLAMAERRSARFVEADLIRLFDDAAMRVKPGCTIEQLINSASEADDIDFDILSLLNKFRDL